MNWAIISFLLWFFLFPSVIQAKVKGQCANCHTMHYSQHGGVLLEWGTKGPYQNLLVNSCVGCHTGVNDGTNTIPYVFSESEPTYGTNTLAGGNFYWVANGCDECGHNVTDIPGVNQDSNFSQTPGFVSGKTCSSCHGSGNMVLTKCIFCHDPKHHADDSGTVVGDDEEVKYRFLSFTAFHPYTYQQGSYNFYGVAGIEDGDWEYTVSSSDHNEYCGAASSGDYSGASHSISRYCAACHWGFYGENTEHWIRHPSDYILPNSGEYANYTTYNPLAPIARLESTLTGMTVASSTVTLGEDQVSCLSCHRPHGSPYPKIMRWDYQGWPGSGTNGCNVCHTTKD
ncbi:cytochrome C, doubled CXXCH domain-containing protein, secreted [Candidatus Desulfofervidus auxilii]|uniref:Cytochrome C, doubled CXXCH domain-containing protein, secreted n=1 Tax=Desulfofervidus auxilii TaxID=1621989 RepID=A0A7U4THM4_DESA2|nr:cytochrome c3 family protein [Candidatus Desulfofervidus auxilii]AMM40351.1 cytochrome C, doubled CXXCH domain-containing protein, secreted [Candidatus Desulfofervidus auxilii]